MAEHATAQEALFALREQIARMEGKVLPALAASQQADAAAGVDASIHRLSGLRHSFEIPDLDAALDGGLPLNGVTEIRTRLMGDAGAASGFVLALVTRLKDSVAAGLRVLWISELVSMQEAGRPYANGMASFGLAPEDILYAAPRKLEDALWIAEAAMGSAALGATVLEVRGNLKQFGLTESRRLSLRAKAAGRPLFILRHAGDEEASSALFRFLAEPAPASERRLPDGSMLGGSIGHPVFRLTLEKSRNPAPLSFHLEWNPRDRQFSLVHKPGEAFSSQQSPAHRGDRLSASGNGQDRPPALGPVLAYERAS
jgi:protein ImuA